MASVLINGLPSQVIQGHSPMELMLNKKMDHRTLCVFGCTCFPCLRPYQDHKFQYHTEKCAYLGPSLVHKGYKCVTTTGRVFISHHVKFNEEEYPFATGFAPKQKTSASPTTSPPLTVWLQNLPLPSNEQPHVHQNINPQQNITQPSRHSP